MMWAQFVYQITPSLIALARELFARHKGDVVAAKAELKAIPDHWANMAEKEAIIDAQLAALKDLQATKEPEPEVKS